MPAAVTDLPPLLRELLESGQFHDSSGTLQSLYANISAEEVLALYGLVRQLRPRATAEIGFALGISGLAILGALEANGGDSRHFVCDPFQTQLVAGQGLAHVRQAGLDHRLQFFEKFPEEVFSGLPPLQFAFIDASHLFDLTLLDFILVDKRLETGGVVGLHDLWMPSLKKVVRYILANRAYRVHPSSPPGPALSSYEHFSSSLKKVLAALPYSDRFLAPEIFRPWPGFHLANMVFLEKLAPDTRDWRQHVAF